MIAIERKETAMNDTAMNDTQKLNYLLNLLKETAERQHCYDIDGEYDSCSANLSFEAFEDGVEFGVVESARAALQNLELYTNTYNKLAE